MLAALGKRDRNMDEIVKTALQSALWPFVVLVSLVVFKGQINKLVSGLRLFRAGSVEVVFDKRLKNLKLDDSRLESLRDLTHEEIGFFLLVSYSDDPDFKYEPGISTTRFYKILTALESAGLIEVVIPEDVSNARHHRLTPEGKRIRAIVLESTSRLFQEHA